MLFASLWCFHSVTVVTAMTAIGKTRLIIFSIESSLEIDKAEVDRNITGRDLLEREISHYPNNESNSKGSSNTVIAVTTVTDNV